MGYAPQKIASELLLPDLKPGAGFILRALFLFQSQRRFIEHGVQNAFIKGRQETVLQADSHHAVYRIGASHRQIQALRSGKGPGGGSRMFIVPVAPGGYRSLILREQTLNTAVFFPGKAVRPDTCLLYTSFCINVPFQAEGRCCLSFLTKVFLIRSAIQ